MKPRPSKPAQIVEEKMPGRVDSRAVASFLISRLPDGSVQYNFFGADVDILGLIEYGKIIAADRARMNAAIAQAQHQAQAASQPPLASAK